MKTQIRKIVEQFLSFGIVGGINTVLALVIYWVCVGMGFHYLIANGIGFIITVAISYVLNNIYTFRDKGEKLSWSMKSLAKVYVSYFFTGIVLNSVLLIFWNKLVGLDKNISPILNLFITVPVNYMLNRMWAYNKGNSTN